MRQEESSTAFGTLALCCERTLSLFKTFWLTARNCQTSRTAQGSGRAACRRQRRSSHAGWVNLLRRRSRGMMKISRNDNTVLDPPDRAVPDVVLVASGLKGGQAVKAPCRVL